MSVATGDGGEGNKVGYSQVLTSDCGSGNSTRNSDSDLKHDQYRLCSIRLCFRSMLFRCSGTMLKGLTDRPRMPCCTLRCN